uniref:BMA-VILN-1 n=1 Tax=Brugia malayi TaxID=6279 RepID=A0A0I9R384_BRUMA|nr:BMA-VILN-1 [Brugia malayi]
MGKINLKLKLCIFRLLIPIRAAARGRGRRNASCRPAESLTCQPSVGALPSPIDYRRKLEQEDYEVIIFDSAKKGLQSKLDYSAVKLRKRQLKSPYPELMRIRVKGDKNIDVRLVPPKYTSVHAYAVFILVTPNQLFVYQGKYSSLLEKSNAAIISTSICERNDKLGCSARHFENVHEGIGTGAFWRLLGLSEEECEDATREEYVPENLLILDKPFENIAAQRTKPLNVVIGLDQMILGDNFDVTRPVWCLYIKLAQGLNDSLFQHKFHDWQEITLHARNLYNTPANCKTSTFQASGQEPPLFLRLFQGSLVAICGCGSGIFLVYGSSIVSEARMEEQTLPIVYRAHAVYIALNDRKITILEGVGKAVIDRCQLTGTEDYAVIEADHWIKTNRLWVWSDKTVSTFALRVANAYWFGRSGPKTVICKTQEPDSFKALFAKWDDFVDEIDENEPMSQSPLRCRSIELDELLQLRTKTWPLEKVKNRDLPPGIDLNRLEQYLNDDDFQSLFRMERIAFYVLPHWKQIVLRKKHKLF